MKILHTKYIPLLLCFVTLAFTLLLLGLGYPEYLQKLDELSLFLPTSMFWSDCMHTPGGALTWAGCFLTQYFYHPWVGATIYALLTAATFAATAWAFGLKGGYYGIAIVPAAMMLLWLLLPGYVIFSLRTTGYAYFGLLGLLCAVLLYWGYTNIKNVALRAVMLVAIIIAGYPLMGVCALLAAVICAVYEMRQHRLGLFIMAVVALVVTGAYPYLYFRHVPTILTPDRIYLAGLPNIMPEELYLWAPYAVSAVALVVMAFAQGSWRQSRHSAIAGCGVFVLSLAAVVVFRYDDPNFKMSIRLDNAINDGDWQRAADIAREIDFEPTRLNTLYTYIALMRMGQAEDLIFTYPAGSARYDSPRESNAMRDAAGILVSYHMGRPYNSYRWAMEYKVEYGMKVHYLKYLAKSALLYGEYDLARKYLNTLAQTKYHKDWADRYMAYANMPSLIAQDTEMSQILPLTVFKDHLGGDGGKIETYLIPIVAGLSGGTPELQNLSLLCNLIQKDVDLFMKKYGPRAVNMQRLPRHYQEAILVWSMVHQTPAYKQFRIDKGVMQRFDQFMNMNRSYINLPRDELKDMMQKSFGDTYWYYFFYADELKTN